MLVVTRCAPIYLLSELVISVAHVPGRTSLHSASRNDLAVPRTRLISGRRAFAVAGLRAQLTGTVNTNTFKRKLKTFLFIDAYE